MLTVLLWLMLLPVAVVAVLIYLFALQMVLSSGICELAYSAWACMVELVRGVWEHKGEKQHE